MKIAGQKNDGAWFRANAALFGNERLGIQPMTEEEKANLAAVIQDSDYLDSAWAAVQNLALETGVELDGFPESKGAWVGRMIIDHGIPRQVWNGRLSFTTYTLTGAPGSRKAVANYQSDMHYFAKDLRRIVVKFLKARRALRDLTNIGGAGQGNPGGWPDAHLPV